MTLKKQKTKTVRTGGFVILLHFIFFNKNVFIEKDKM